MAESARAHWLQKKSSKKHHCNKSADNGNIKAESVGVENGKENNKSRIVQQNQGEVRTGAEIRIDRRRGTESQSSDSGIGKNRKLPEENRRERIGRGKLCEYFVIESDQYSQNVKER